MRWVAVTLKTVMLAMTIPSDNYATMLTMLIAIRTIMLTTAMQVEDVPLTIANVLGHNVLLPCNTCTAFYYSITEASKGNKISECGL